VQLVDTHCHIQSIGLDIGERTTQELWAKEVQKSPGSVIADAVQNGVSNMICVGCDLGDSQLAVDFVQDHPECHASIGIHPHEAQHFAGQNDLLNAFAALVVRPRVVAVGETGLDYYYAHSSRKDQETLLRFQIELAMKHDLPLIFHVRDAFDDFWPIFESYQTSENPLRGVLHSFTDTVENLQKAVSHGLYIGVNGIATFAKAEEQRVMYRTIPQRLLLLETDAPFLTPIPFRGTINEPKYTRVVAEFLSELRGEDQEALADATTTNAKTLFRL
jgi:TatD DNase family protein